jgi:hypothetical protein
MKITAFRLDWTAEGFNVGLPRFFGIDDVRRLALLLETRAMNGLTMPTIVPLFSDGSSVQHKGIENMSMMKIIEHLQAIKPKTPEVETTRNNDFQRGLLQALNPFLNVPNTEENRQHIVDATKNFVLNWLTEGNPFANRT